MIGFIFGLMLGSSMSGGNGPNPQIPPMLNEIPFRCIAAIDQGDDIYRDCRRLTMLASIGQSYRVLLGTDQPYRDYKDRIDMQADKAMNVEIAALHALADEVKKQAPKQP